MISSNWDRLYKLHNILHYTKQSLQLVSLSCCAVLCVYPYCCGIVGILSQVLVPIEQTNNAYPSHGNLAAAILCQLFEELLWVFVRVSPNIECSFFQVYLLCNL